MLSLQRFFQKYSNPAMAAGGVFTALGLVLSRLPGAAELGTAAYLLGALLCGAPILFRALQSLWFKVVGIECLVSIAVLGACWIGEFSEAAIVTFLFQFGAYLEQKTLAKTRSAIKALTDLAPTTAWRLRDGIPEQIDAEDVEPEDRLLVKTGGQVAADGTVLSGDGFVREASITGESQPRHVSPGDTVYAGSILESGTLEMEAKKVGEDTTFAKIIELVEQAQDAKSPAERFIDRFARYYTPAVVLLALGVLLFTRNLDTAITVLVLACPGALVIGAPIANVAGIGRGAREGILLKGGDSIRTFAKTDTFVFDKTGTLTQGRPQVTRQSTYGMDLKTALSLAAGAESRSDHPLGKAVLEYAAAQGIPPGSCTRCNTQTGLGLDADVDGHRVLVGSPRLLTQAGLVLPEALRADLAQAQAQGATVVVAAVDGVPALLLSVQDALKPDAMQALESLRKLGVSRLVMLTGDNEKTAAAIAEALALTDFRAELLPRDKLAYVRQLRQAGRTVTFVGDGINDSPALTEADTGIAMGSGTDVAMEVSQVVLMKSDLQSLAKALVLCRWTNRVLWENIAIAVGTVIALLLGLFAGYIHMSLGMLIHEASILLVIFNAMRLLLRRNPK